MNFRMGTTKKGGNVIARIWHGWTKAEDADGYEEHLKPELLPGLSKVKGFQGSYLLRRVVGDETEFITIILWDSIEAVKAVAGAGVEEGVSSHGREKYFERFCAEGVAFVGGGGQLQNAY